MLPFSVNKIKDEYIFVVTLLKSVRSWNIRSNFSPHSLRARPPKYRPVKFFVQKSWIRCEIITIFLIDDLSLHWLIWPIAYLKSKPHAIGHFFQKKYIDKITENTEITTNHKLRKSRLRMHKIDNRGPIASVGKVSLSTVKIFFVLDAWFAKGHCFQ